jgi:hypothetical protein
VGPGTSLDVCENSRPTGIRSLDRPARSQSLYRLSYHNLTIVVKGYYRYFEHNIHTKIFILGYLYFMLHLIFLLGILVFVA